MKQKIKLVIGRKDKVDFPELGIFNIDAKIDTGAYTSSLYCRNINVEEKAGVKKISFNVLDPTHPEYSKKKFKLPIFTKRKIKNSFGQTEERYIIMTKILLFDKLFDLELSLSDRGSMKNPILLGRKLLSNVFLVDVAKFDLSFKEKQKKGGEK